MGTLNQKEVKQLFRKVFGEFKLGDMIRFRAKKYRLVSIPVITREMTRYITLEDVDNPKTGIFVTLEELEEEGELIPDEN